MEGSKKIDLDAPLLSTRRFSTEPSSSSSSSFTGSSNCNSGSTNPSHRRSSLPFYKPDLKSGPVRNPGVVPFVWEQKPGQPKPGTGSPSRPPIAVPRPPPAKLGSSVRTRKPNFANSIKEAIDPSIENFNQTKNERLKEELDIKKADKFDQHSRVVPERIQATSSDCTSKDESKDKEKYKEKLKEEKEKQIKEKLEGEEEAQSEEDNFSDALDTLSRTESFVMNCSISGLSELHAGPKDQNNSLGVSDPEAREFMMDRFLPAAQAVATGSPQYTFRKVPVLGREPPKPPLFGNGTSPDQRRVPVPLPYQHQPKYDDNFEEEEEEEGEEEEDDEEDLDASRRFHAKGCGFFPGFCVKGSLLLMNPVPCMKSSGRVVRPKGGVGRNGSPLIRSSINGAVLKDSHEAFENYMHSWEPVYKHKQDQKNNRQNKPIETSKKNSDTSHLTYWSDSPNTRDGSSPLLHSAGSNGEDQARKAPSPPLHESNGKDTISNPTRSNSIAASLHSSRNVSGSLDKDPNPFSDAQEMESSGEVISGFQERENVIKKMNASVLPLPLPLPKSPSESWLSRTLPSVSVRKQPVPSFLGMQNKRQGEERWRA